MNTLSKVPGKAAYLFVMLLLATKCLNIRFLYPALNGNPGLVLYLFWLIIGVVLFGRKVPKSIFNIRTLLPVILMFAGVILSFLPAKIYYGQPIITSLLASRVVLFYLTLPVLLIVRPSMSRVRMALYFFSLLFILVFVIDTYLGIQIVLKTEREMLLSIDDVSYVDGIHFVAMSLFFALPRAFKCPNAKNIAIAAALFLCILLFQNRTTLFAVVILIVWYLLKLPNTRRYVPVKISVAVLAAIIVAASSNLIIKLITETTGDLTNDNYNRSVALAYFISEAPQGFLSYIFGNGFLSAHTTSLMQDMMEYGVYNSDVGFLGMWNQFGLIPVLTVTITCIMGFFGKSSSLVKFNAAFILLCAASTGYFFEPSKILWLCLFWYIFISERNHVLK